MRPHAKLEGGLNRFGYDNQFRLTTTSHPGSVTTVRGYDKDGRVKYRTAPVTWDTLNFDGSGRVVSGSVHVPATSTTRQIVIGYNALGALQWAQGPTPGITSEEYTTDALGNRLWVRDPEVVDAVDRTRYETYTAETGQLTSMALGTAGCGTPPNNFSCHPAWYQYEYSQSHDASGNVDATWGKETRGGPASPYYVPEETRSYYSADEKLTYYNRHFGWSAPGEVAGVFDEYRYDPLGRRVLLRSRTPSVYGRHGLDATC